MRPTALACCVVLLLAARGPAQDDARAVLERAIKAHGGEEKLGRIQASYARNKGVIHQGEDRIPFTQELHAQLPGRFRSAMHFENEGNKVTVLTVFDGEKGWLQVGDMTRELDAKALAAMKETGHVMRVTRLLPLRDGKTYQLELLGEDTVGGRPVVGLKVSAKGQRDVSLYFDKETGLLARTKRLTADPRTGQEVTEERVPADYQDRDGVKEPRRAAIYHDGRKVMDVEAVEFKYLDKLADDLFAKP